MFAAWCHTAFSNSYNFQIRKQNITTQANQIVIQTGNHLSQLLLIDINIYKYYWNTKIYIQHKTTLIDWICTYTADWSQMMLATSTLVLSM